MALEDYFKKDNINIKNLAFENPGRRESFDIRKSYEALKKTALYDPERKQWNSGMNEDQVLRDAGRCSEDQLYGVLTEMVFGKEKGRELYKSLKFTPLYDKKKKRWNWQIGNTSKDTDYSVTAELLDILISSSFNKR